MKTRINILFSFVVLLAALAAVWISWRLNVSANVRNEASSALIAKNALLREQLSNSGQTENLRTQSPEKLAKAAGARVQVAKLAEEKRRAESEARQRAYYDRLNKDHDYRLKYYASKRSDMDEAYGPFFHRHRFTPEQIEAVCDALLQKELRYDRVPSTYFEQNLPTNDGTLAKQLYKEADEEFNNAIQARLGDDLAAEFATYERARAAWDEVGEFAGRMAIAGTPVSLEQATQLVDAICAANPSFVKGRKIAMSQIDWNAVDAQAATFLSAEQVEYLKTAVPSRQSTALDKAIRKLREAGKTKDTNSGE